jgi:phosphatidylglycerophosphatase A
MTLLAKFVATCAGIGYTVPKGAGTIAAAAGCLLWWWLLSRGLGDWLLLAGILVVFFAGVWSSALVEKQWGKDPNRVVVDELLGMWVSLYLLPFNWKYFLAAFLIFRFFDIVKPLYIRKAEQLPSGWGIMADDLLAGIYTNLLLQLAATLNLF